MDDTELRKIALAHAVDLSARRSVTDGAAIVKLADDLLKFLKGESLPA